MRFFNTEGPNRSDDHYTLPPLGRWDLDLVLELIEQKKYFLLHAPRQTGKTTCLLALTAYLNAAGHYRALYANIEPAQACREDVASGMAVVVQAIAGSARWRLGDEQAEALAEAVLTKTTGKLAVQTFLNRWCAASDQPLILILDEVDALVGDTLISLLRQLRAGYEQRPNHFPHALILCGVRDIQDYRIFAKSEADPITGGSAFNIKAKSLRLGDFNQAEMTALLLEHTRETGQQFTPAALDRCWDLTQGQPWLINALAYGACFEDRSARDRSQPIDLDRIEAAKERMILERVTHLDQLAYKLREPRVRRVIEPMLAGLPADHLSDDDVRYLIDLGLVRLDATGGLVVANPIYREVLPRALAFSPQASLPQISPTWLTADGQLDPHQLLDAFLAFWRRHGEPMLGSAPYHEIAPHLVLMAFLHRVVNGGGTIEREYAIGRGRMDLCLRYGTVTLAMELKVWRDGRPDPLGEGLGQLDAYLAGLGLTTGWLVIFDRRGDQPPIAERTTTAPAVSPAGRVISVIRA
jgi:hypothetical protein